MTKFRTPKFWLLTTAALIFGSQMSASAQTPLDYQSGAPTMVAAAPGLPSISAEQIARDVTSEFNPRTGLRELVAAPFDPFEEDPTLAGSLRLRSANGAVDINGQPLRDGALVELDFYYNSPSDDPYGGRNYGDVSFVNGELAPVVLRDSRILECSTRVENVVYDHNSYYDRGYSLGIYRPYRHYAGHSGFGFGFGNNYYGPGYGYYGGRRDYRDRGYRRSRGQRRGTHSRVLDAVRNRDGSDRNRDGRRNSRAEDGNGRFEPRRTNSRRLTDRDIDERLSRVQSYGTGRNRSEVNRNNRRGNGPMRAGNPDQRNLIRMAPERSPVSTSTTGRTQPRSNAERRRDLTRSAPDRRETREARPRNNAQQRREITRSEPRRAETRREQPRSNGQRRRDITRSAPRRSETRRSEPRRQSNPRPKRTSQPTRRISRGDLKQRIKKNFFPNSGYAGRSVVSSRSVDCAREDKLRIFIPNERLDAARFDGLTLIAFDAQGGEAPIYLPPNYIEGYRLAASGQVRPQGISSVPQYGSTAVSPPVSLPSQTIEAAPCPVGTTKQANGTCLQTSGTFGYPTR